MSLLRILIVDDHEAVRRGIRSLLSSRADWLVCGEAADGLEAVEKTKSLRPDVVLMDISMPRMDGVQASRIIRREVPESQVIVISQNDPAVVSKQAAEIDALGYIAKADLFRDLLPTIDRLLAGRSTANAPVPNSGDNGTESTVSQKGVAIDTSIHGGAVSLETVLCTEELYRRSLRPPAYEKENRALVALSHALADSPRTILQTLADTILEVCQVDSAGLSLLTTDDGGKRFYWPAIAGRWKPHIGGGTPRDFGPCGDVLDRNIPLLFRHFEWRYTYFQPVTPPVEECLLVPFYVEGKAVGTIWAIAHDDRRKFDAEDERLMSSLGKFASSAYQILASLDALKFQMAEREKAETALRTLTGSLEEQVQARTEELEQRNAEVQKQAEELRQLSHRMMQVQDEERRHLARELHDSAGQIITAIGMDLASITEHVELSPPVGKAIQDSQKLIQQVSREIRTMSYLLHPPLLDENGLSEAIRWYMRGLAERSDLKIELRISEDFGRLTREIELAVFRIVQECLTNIHRHSGSKTATIQLSRAAERVFLEVQDKGKGISAEKLTEIQAQHSGVGITGMRERVRHLGGDINIESNSRGTNISVMFPVPKIALDGIQYTMY